MIDASGRSKGCAIVEFNTPADAMAAINMMNNTELNGRPMFVREDRESENADGGRNGALQARPPNPECRIYVSNLSWDVTWTDLKDHFKQSGASNVVRADILTEAGGRSKGCGIVEFATPAFARRAIETMNNSVLRGRPVFVREDRDVGGRGAMPPTSTFSAQDRPMASLDENRALPTERSPPSLSRGSPSATKLYVGNLDWNVNWPMLKDYFKKAGSVNHAEVVTDVTGKSKGFAIVEMASHEDALNAIHALNNTVLGSRQINVRLDAKPDSM
jgi:RNA recognition motif-containing protein